MKEIPPTPESFGVIAAATDRLLAQVAELDDKDIAAPSRLPGWTRGHVLSHLARQAPALERLLEWARTGVETPQYPSRRARDAEIEAGARQTGRRTRGGCPRDRRAFPAHHRGTPGARLAGDDPALHR